MIARLGIMAMRLLAGLPLAWVRALGWLLGARERAEIIEKR